MSWNIQEMWSCEWEFFCWTVVSASHSHSHWFFFFSVMLFTFDFNFSSSVITFHFFAALSPLLANFLFHLFSFIIRCHMVSPRDRRATSYVLCYLYMNWMNRCSVVNPDRRWKKHLDGLLTVMAVSYLPSDWWTEELIAKFVLCAIIHT